MRPRLRIVYALLAFVCLPCVAWSAELSDAVDLWLSGQYRQCSQFCAAAIEEGEYSETWRNYKIQADLASGRYEDALTTLEAALTRYKTSIRLRWLGHEVYLWNGREDRAAEMLDQIDKLTDGSSWRYSDPLSRVALGRFYLHRGVDPKIVLKDVYGAAKRRTRSFAEPFVAAGELALEKHDYALAGEEFQAALERDKRDADIYYGLARAFAPSDDRQAQEYLRAALERNPRHIESLLLLADRHIDAESYDEAHKVLREVLQVNPATPQAWAYLAVLFHLDNDPVSEEVCRQMALARRQTNPEVDGLIGQKLSQKYRFAEGSSYQRRALEMDADWLPAKIALSQDLLRLGQEEEGWQLAEDVFQRDAYNVVAHNLTTLRDHLDGFRTISRDGIFVRMDPEEAEIYGELVLDLLSRAKRELCAKYRVQLEKPTLVEIFPEQQDFAIRTFGLPGGDGFLGVCFGDVITANSPASQTAHPTNWQSTLWHEFCHVVTLNKTSNKMPRWLSEGISVYEEWQADPAWGEKLNPTYREMILGGQLTPVSQLSGAFLTPPSPVHLQFAYYESALVIQHLIETYGAETLERILVDLSVGMPINDTLARHTGSIFALDAEFATYAREVAERMGPQLDWERPDFPPGFTLQHMAQWNRDHPDNFWGLQQLAAALIAGQRWREAELPLERLRELCPEYAGQDGPYPLLARVYRELGETRQERAVLEELVRRRADALDAYERMLQLAAGADDWEVVMATAEQMLAVDPLQRSPHRYLARAAEALGDSAKAVGGLRALVRLGPHDPADVHYRLARHLLALNQLAAARRHILHALEEAPRFRAAHRTLLDILEAIQASQEPAAPTAVSQAEVDS